MNSKKSTNLKKEQQNRYTEGVKKLNIELFILGTFTREYIFIPCKNRRFNVLILIDTRKSNLISPQGCANMT